ncbi:glucosamine-6-phosphate deaminase [Amygdalobacter nucleatus]|uniref:Glucosamine-6-phosphate deaminase n=1 Tax=Amygdalobacter nucleatus TaxID=3029274 RepID=A0A133YFM9_9FIRM|nr:glucosamine-6-phosphate deaminase [Amygdalobacter nucleatus]KXB41995.1 glucosamine-6-phosphate deaminase [Amygdalobacter nucleatus]MDF0485652.1 glucosamine-6-phosphate deaminase [Amygdalobacter nucleatus]
MNVIKVKDQVAGGQAAFKLIKQAIEAGAQVLGLATGSSPETLYQEMVNSDLDFSNMLAFNLDEYVGLAADNEQSYHYFMQEHLFKFKPFKATYIENGLAKDLEAEVERYEQLLQAHTIDVQILGIGVNGHIGFNEPGTSFDSLTHVTNLTESTIQANKRFFNDISEVPTKALTMGIKSILQSKQIILLAYGKAKAPIIKRLLSGEVTEEVPASALQKHPNVTIIIDEEAASLL